MNDILTIMKKELTRFLTDKRMIATLFLPGILIYVMYSLMGGLLNDTLGEDEDHIPNVCTVNTSQYVYEILSSVNMNVVEMTDVQAGKDAVTQGTCDVLVVFDENFDENVMNYDVSQGKAPDVELYYNSTVTESSSAYSAVMSLLSAYEGSMVNKFDINANVDAEYDMASEEEVAAMFYSMLMPMLLLMFLFTGCMAVAPEAISGEKERGTMATLLITPVPRERIALGKIFALSIIALLSGASSTIGTILSIPKLMEGSGVDFSSAYKIGDYMMLAGVILTTLLVIITVMSIVSAYANTMKEAQMISTPLMIAVMAIGIVSVMGASSADTSLALYAIPIYNSSLCINDVFSLTPDSVGVAITCVSNIVFTVLGIFVLTRMFDSEKIMFRK